MLNIESSSWRCGSVHKFTNKRSLRTFTPNICPSPIASFVRIVPSACKTLQETRLKFLAGLMLVSLAVSREGHYDQKVVSLPG